jgi:hypothetical protein
MKRFICIAALCLGLASASEDSPLMANAMEALARASSTSEVLTLNITNLIILGIIKALIIGAGIFLGSQNAGAASSRSSDGSNTVSITNGDLNGGLCFMMYTSGAYEKLDCIKRSACEDPKTAKDYLQGAKMWMKLHQLMKVVPFEERYYDIMTHVQEAVDVSAAGGDCSVYHW